jgi:GNAT superfamily N-acetyltransferase
LALATCEISNRIAPEHLEVSSRDPQRWEAQLRHAGAIFLGAFTSESLGDYCAGPNHVLPTSGTARFSSPLGIYDFQKRSSLIEVSEAGAAVLGPIAVELARGEGLQAHARAAEMRLAGADPSSTDSSPARGFHVRAVDAGNVDALIELAVSPAQQGFVASAAKSLAQAAHVPGGRALALYDDDQPVGLLLLYDARRDGDKPAEQLVVWRLMIDARFQRRGHGSKALRWAIDEAKRMGLPRIALSHVPDNPVGDFYQSFGFAYTGEIDHNERVMALDLDCTRDA